MTRSASAPRLETMFSLGSGVAVANSSSLRSTCRSAPMLSLAPLGSCSSTTAPAAVTISWPSTTASPGLMAMSLP